MKVGQRPARDASKVGIARRRRALLVLAVTALLVVPAAISWACGPNRAIQLDRYTYTPGQDVQVTGANFEPEASVSIKVNGTAVATTTVSGTGSINTSFSAPSAAGTYTAVSDGVDQNGQALAGTGNAVTFAVAAAAAPSSPTAPAPSQGGAPRSGATSPAPGTTSGRGGSRGTAGGNSRSVGGGERVGAGAGGGGAVNTTEGVIESAGTTAFAGSVPREARASAAEGGAASRSGKAAGRPSERSAGAGLWSGLASSKNPSLVPGANDAGAPAANDRSGLTLALALLGAGFLSLVGLGLAEAQRRRSRATAS